MTPHHSPQVYTYPAAAGITYEGCYKDDGTRKVPNILDASYGASVTIGNCAALARSKGYTLFALQDGGSCWGGSDMTRAKSLGASTDCRKACTGDSTRTCGNGWINQIYSVSATAPSNTAAAPTCSTGACYSPLGCFKDCNAAFANGTPGFRGLPTFLASAADMTPAK